MKERYITLIYVMTLLTFISLVYASPLIDFVNPTPANGSSQINNSIFINYTVSSVNDSYSFINFDNSLAGWWRMDNDSSVGENDTLVYDWSGNGNNGTITNAIFDSSGRFGGTFNFDGDTDYIDVSNSDILNGSSYATVSMWILQNGVGYPFNRYLGSEQAKSIFAIRKTATASYYFYLGTNDTDDNRFCFISNTGITGGVWNHVVVTANYSNGNVSLYENGEYTDSCTIVGLNNSMIMETGGVFIGSSRPTSNFFNGSLDEILVFKRLLNVNEVKALYNASNTYRNFTNLTIRSYEATINAVDNQSNLNQSTRVFTISSNDSAYPLFYNHIDNNATLLNNGTGLFNVSINYTNGTVLLEIDGNNVTSTNNSNEYGSSYAFTEPGLYPYTWHSWGNGSYENYNRSETRYYYVNDTIAPRFTGTSNQSIYRTQPLNYNINATDSGFGIDTYTINWSTNFTINASTGVLTNSSVLAVGYYIINVSVNDTVGNTNSTLLSVNVSVNASTCQTLTSDYTLENNVQGGGRCFNITSSNLKLDCQGHTITFALNQSGLGIGAGVNNGVGILISSQKNNITIENCVFENGNTSLSNVSALRIYSSNISLINNTFRLNSTVTSGKVIGVDYRLGGNSTFTNNTINITGCTARGIDDQVSGGQGGDGMLINNNVFNINAICANNENRYGTDSFSNTTISNNTIIYTGVCGNTSCSRGYCIRGYGMKNNIIYGNHLEGHEANVRTLSIEGNEGATVAATNNTIYDNYIFANHSDAARAIRIRFNAYNNSFYDNTIYALGGGNDIGIYIGDSYDLVRDNNIFNNSIHSDYAAIYYDSGGTNGTNNYYDNLINGSDYGVLFRKGSNNEVFYNNEFNCSTSCGGGHYDVRFSENNSNGNYFLNNTMNFSSISFNDPLSGDSNISFGWFLTINVTNALNGTIQDAIVNIYDINSNLVQSQNTSSEGIIETNLTEYTQNISDTFYSTNYTLQIVKENYQTTNFSLNLTTNAIELFTLQSADTTSPVVALLSPPNASTVSTLVQYFNASFTDDIQLANVTFYLWNSSGNLVNTTTLARSGTSNTSNLSVTLPYEDTFTWNYQATDNSSNAAFNSTNYTITLDLTGPQVAINTPAATTYTSSSITFNVTLNENGTVWFSTNNGAVNYTMNTTNNQNFNYTNSSIPDGSYTFLVYANDTLGNTNFTQNVSFTIDTSTSESNGGSSSGGGGGGGSSFGQRTYNVASQEFKNGYTKALRKGSSLKFQQGNESHTLKIDQIFSTSVTITVSSDPITFNLSIGRSKKIDSNNDSFLDLFVQLNNITGASLASRQAEVFVQEINESLQKVESNVDYGLNNASESGESSDVNFANSENNSIIQTGGTGVLLFIFISTLIAIIVIGIVLHLLSSTKKGQVKS